MSNATYPLSTGQAEGSEPAAPTVKRRIPEWLTIKVPRVKDGRGARPENNLYFFARTEMFPTKHLGGCYESIRDLGNYSGVAE